MEQPRLDFVTLGDGTKLFYRMYRPHGRYIRERPQSPGEANATNTVEAEPPVVVAIHGYAGNHTSWLPVLESLEEHGVNTLVFDLRGHGLSAKPHAWREYDWERFTADFLELLAQLHVSRAVVLGYSAGGAIALNAALRAPTVVERLVLISTNHRNPMRYWNLGYLTRPGKAALHLAAWLVGWYHRRTYNFADIRTLSGYWHSVYRGLTSMPLAVNLRCLATMGELDLSAQLSAIAQPTLILRSLHDPLVTAREANDMVHRMPHAKLMNLDVGGHWLLTRHAGRLYATIKDFLEEPLPTTAAQTIPPEDPTEAKPHEILFEDKGIE